MWTKGKLPHSNASARQVGYMRARQFHSDPFKNLVLGCITSGVVDNTSLLHPRVSSLMSDLHSHARSIDRQNESYQIGRQQRTARPFNPLSNMMAQLMGYDEDSEDESGDYVHSFTNLYKTMKKHLEDLESDIDGVKQLLDDDDDAVYKFLTTSMKVRMSEISVHKQDAKSTQLTNTYIFRPLLRSTASLIIAAAELDVQVFQGLLGAPSPDGQVDSGAQGRSHGEGEIRGGENGQN
jgi:hypothetical protein